MPGFVDTHRHLWEGILRNIGVDIPLEGERSYLAFVLNTLAPAYRPEDVYVGNRVSTLGLIDAGVTTILDWSHIQAAPEYTEAAIRALQESCLRAVFAYGPVWYEAPNRALIIQAAAGSISPPRPVANAGLAGFGPEFNSLEGQADWQLARGGPASPSMGRRHLCTGKWRRWARRGCMGQILPLSTAPH
jgi:hypothetical protein